MSDHRCTDDPRECPVCRFDALVVVRVAPALHRVIDAFNALPEPLRDQLRNGGESTP